MRVAVDDLAVGDRCTDAAEIRAAGPDDEVIRPVTATVSKLREHSPLWEMHQEGIDVGTVQWAAH